MKISFITNEQLYNHAIEPVGHAKSFVWIGTADIKDLQVHHKGAVQSFLSVLDSLIKKKVAIRLLHAKEPGVNFEKVLTNTLCYGTIWRGRYVQGSISNILLLMVILLIQVLQILPVQVCRV